MKRLLNRLPKKMLAVFASIALLISIGVSVGASFGPDRPTFTWDKPANYVTFNSMTDNPKAGDERYFLTGSKPGGSFTDPVTGLQDGEVVTLRMYVHNNAASNLNLKAENTRVRVQLPAGSKQAQQITGFISANNAAPTVVSDTLDLSGVNNGFFELEYIAGSASYKNNVGTFKLSDSIVSNDGALVGYDQMNGVVPGCEEFSGWVTLKVKVNMPRYVIQKSARLAGEGADKWRENVNAKIGDTIEWRIEFRNIGSTTLNDVVVLDELPPYMTAEKGTVKLINSNHPVASPYMFPDTAIQQKDGKIYVNTQIGDYLPNSNGFVRFSSKIISDPKISCDNHKLTNKSYATPSGYGAVSSYAYVTVVNDKACEPPKPQSITCDALKVDILNNKTREVEAKVTGSAQNTTITGYKIDFGDNTVVNQQTAKHTYVDYGKYTIKAYVTGTVDGKTVTVGGDGGCVKTVEFTKPPEPQSIACSALTVSILNKDSREVEAKVTGSAQNTTITGYKIDFGDNTVVNQQTAKHTYVDYGKYTIKAYVTGTVDGKTVTVGGDGGCVKTIEFTKPEPPKQAITCDVLTLNILNNKTREVEAKVTGSAQNTTITGYKIDFGDGTVVNEQTAKHTFADYGKYTVKAHVSGTVDGKPVTVSSDGCVQMVEFKKPPEPTVQTIKCDALTLDLFNKDKKYVKVSVKATAVNTKIDKYSIDFGDGSTPASTQTAEHTYSDYGTYKIVAKVTGMVDGKQVTDSNVNCEQTVEFKKPGVPPVTPPPAELPNTGAGALIGLFSGVSILGAVGHRMWTIKRMQ
jgi:uncharacterized repeat protein (TIGR01451 family)